MTCSAIENSYLLTSLLLSARIIHLSVDWQRSHRSIFEQLDLQCNQRGPADCSPFYRPHAHNRRRRDHERGDDTRRGVTSRRATSRDCRSAHQYETERDENETSVTFICHVVAYAYAAEYELNVMFTWNFAEFAVLLSNESKSSTSFGWGKGLCQLGWPTCKGDCRMDRNN